MPPAAALPRASDPERQHQDVSLRDGPRCSCLRGPQNFAALRTSGNAGAPTYANLRAHPCQRSHRKRKRSPPSCAQASAALPREARRSPSPRRASPTQPASEPRSLRGGPMRAAESRRDIASGHTAIPLLSEAPAPETRPLPRARPRWPNRCRTGGGRGRGAPRRQGRGESSGMAVWRSASVDLGVALAPAPTSRPA